MRLKTPKSAFLTTVAVATVGLMAAGLAIMSGPAQARGGAEIVTFANKCLDVEGGNPGDLARIIQYGCHGQFNQQFYLHEAGHGEVEIRTFAGKCLDVEGGNRGDLVPIIQYTCHGQANQKFRIWDIRHGQVQITTFAGKCLDVQNGDRHDLVPIIQYTCHDPRNAYNQAFRIV